MTPNLTHRTARWLVGACLAAASACPFAVGQTTLPDEDVIVLSPFVVDTTRDFGYRATQAITATRVGIPIEDTPLSVQVITSEFLRDVAVSNFSQAFNYTPGVSKNNSEDWSVLGSLRIRGFTPDFIYRNSFRQYRAFFNDGIDRIEVVKGPATVFFGKVEPGGLVNYSTKRPEDRWATSVDFSYGDNNEYRGVLDHQGVILENMLSYRVVGSWRQNNSWRDFIDNEETYLLGAIKFQPWERLTLNLDVESYARELQGAGAYGMIANLEYLDFVAAGRSLTLPDNTSTTTPSLEQYRQWVFRTTGAVPTEYTGFWFPRGRGFNRQGPGTLNELEGYSVTLEALLNIAEGLNLRVAANQSADDETTNVFFNADPHQSPVNFAFPRGTNGSFTAINYGFLIGPKFVPDDATWWTMPGALDNENTLQTLQADLVYDFELLEARHTLTASYEVIYDEYLQFQYIPNLAQFRADGGTPANSWGDPDPFLGGYFVEMNSNTPVPDYRRWLGPRNVNSSDGARRYDYGVGLSYYGRWFDERLHVLTGLRRVEARSIGQSRDGSGIVSDVPVPGVGWAERDGTVPMVGVVFRATDDINLFANYSESFKPNTRGQIGANRVYTHDPAVNPSYTGPTTVGGETLDNETGVGMEFGAKFGLLDNRLSGTISLFRVDKDQIEQRDATRESDLTDAGFTPVGGGTVELYRNSGLQRTEGVEFEAIYQPMDNYQLIFSYAYLWKRDVVTPDPSVVHVSRGGTFDPDWDPATPGNQNDGRDRDWKEIANVPDHTLGIWNKYTFTEGFLDGAYVGLGATYRGESPADQERARFGYINESYWLVDALVGYETEVFGRPMNVALNVNNLLDEEYVNGQQGGYGDPRTWRLTVGYKF